MTTRHQVFIPSPESGIELELIVAKPSTKGPYPTLIFNHGSTGNCRPAIIRRTMIDLGIQNYFTDRGWMVLFPQRRGRGKSGGRYAEGLDPKGRDYSCVPEIAMQGFERAVVDLDAVMAYVRCREDVSQRRLVIAGASRGGILSIAYAGLRPKTFNGAINFNGGWLGRLCPTHEFINPKIFRLGAADKTPTLWLHGKFDRYYRLAHCRKNFEVYIAAGGRGTFIAAPAGHGLVGQTALWKNAVDTYLASFKRQFELF